MVIGPCFWSRVLYRQDRTFYQGWRHIRSWCDFNLISILTTASGIVGGSRKKNMYPHTRDNFHDKLIKLVLKVAFRMGQVHADITLRCLRADFYTSPKEDNRENYNILRVRFVLAWVLYSINLIHVLFGSKYDEQEDRKNLKGKIKYFVLTSFRL